MDYEDAKSDLGFKDMITKGEAAEDPGDWVLMTVTMMVLLLGVLVGVVGHLLLLFRVVSRPSLQTISNLHLVTRSIADLLTLWQGVLFFSFFFSDEFSNSLLCMTVTVLMVVGQCASPQFLACYGLDCYLGIYHPRQPQHRWWVLKSSSVTVWAAVSVVTVVVLAITEVYEGGISLCAGFSFFFPTDKPLKAVCAAFQFTALLETWFLVSNIIGNVGWSETPPVLKYLTLAFTACHVPYLLVQNLLMADILVPLQVEIYSSLLLYVNPCIDLIIYANYHKDLLFLSNVSGEPRRPPRRN